MFWGVALPGDNLPIPASDRQCLTVAQPLIVVGERRSELAKTTKAVPVVIQLRVGKSGAVVKGSPPQALARRCSP